MSIKKFNQSLIDPQTIFVCDPDHDKKKSRTESTGILPGTGSAPAFAADGGNLLLSIVAKSGYPVK